MSQATHKNYEVNEPITDSDIGYGTLAYTLLIGVLILIVTIIGLRALYWASVNDEFERKIIPTPYAEYIDLRAAQEAQLLHSSWVDPATETVSIPLAEAQQKLIAQEARNGLQPTSDGKLDAAAATDQPVQGDAADEAGEAADGLSAAPAAEQDESGHENAGEAHATEEGDSK